MYKKALSLVVLFMMVVSIMPAATAATADTSDRNIQVTRIVVHPDGPDLNFTIYYDTSLFTRVFSIFFGAKTVQPSIENTFVNFTNVTVTRIDLNTNEAEVSATNQTHMNGDGLYVYDRSAAFPERIRRLEVRDTSEGPMIVENADSLPFFTISV